MWSRRKFTTELARVFHFRDDLCFCYFTMLSIHYHVRSKNGNSCFQFFQHLLTVLPLAARHEGHVGGVVPLVGHVQLRHVLVDVGTRTEGILTEELAIVTEIQERDFITLVEGTMLILTSSEEPQARTRSDGSLSLLGLADPWACCPTPSVLIF